MNNIFKNKTLMITGGTGSFGNAVLKRFIKMSPLEIRILSRDEKKQNDMRNHYKNNRIKFYIGDIRDYESVDNALKGVDYVFHAAALKQVPSCEFFPLEAIKTNILGANNIINSSFKNNVKKLIMLSTDKSVYPINAMGMTKGLMEKIAIAKSREFYDKKKIGTVVCCTRYGNVMASRGSVIPLFFDQLQKNKYLTVTNPNMTRFLMSLEESVDLVFYAFKHAKPGDIFVYKSPAATIETLAKAIMKLSKTKGVIKKIGIRHGEKLFETLVSEEEMQNIQNFKKFYRIIPDNRNLDYERYFNKGNKININKSYNSHNTDRLSVNDVIDKIKKLKDFNYKKYA